QQIDAGLVCPVSGACTSGQAVINAGSSTLWGVEVDSQLLPFEGFKLDFNGSYLNTKVDTLTVPTAPPPFVGILPSAVPGGELPFASKWKASVTGTYTLPLPAEVGTVDLGVTYIYDSGYEVIAPSASPYYQQGRVNLVNLNLNWTNVFGHPIDASF